MGFPLWSSMMGKAKVKTSPPRYINPCDYPEHHPPTYKFYNKIPTGLYEWTCPKCKMRELFEI